MEVEFLSRTNPALQDGAQQVYALHGPDASLELSMLRALMQLRDDALPVLPALLQPPPTHALPQPAGQLQSAADIACLEAESRHAVADAQLIVGNLRPEGPGDGAGELRCAELAAAAQATVEADGLNAAQAVALRSAAAWLEPDAQVTSTASP
jgi:hypothetical protein